MSKWFKRIFLIEINITKDRIMLNNMRGQNSAFINKCLLIAKQYIYTCTCLRKKPVFIEITTKIHTMYLDEEYIAGKNKRKYKHDKMWKLYKEKMYIK